MPPRLTHDDGRAVDLVLDRPEPRASGNGHANDERFVMSDAHIEQRVQRVEQLLALLHEFPTGDVPGNLIGRTIRHIARASAGTTLDQPHMPNQQASL